MSMPATVFFNYGPELSRGVEVEMFMLVTKVLDTSRVGFVRIYTVLFSLVGRYAFVFFLL